MIAWMLGWSLVAVANDGPPPFIEDLRQEQQDVVVTVWLADIGEPGFDDEVTVQRDGRPAVSGTFSLEDAREVEARCWSSGDVSTCDRADVECLDCDGDGADDCAPDEYRLATCYRSGLVDLVDGCVAPGEHGWTTGGFDDEGLPAILEVSAVDLSCLPEDSEASSGCSATGAPVVAWSTGLALLGLGLLGLRRNRRGSGGR